MIELNQSKTYNANYSPSNATNVSFQWSIIPSTAGTISGSSTNTSVLIIWNVLGMHQVRLQISSCNQTIETTFTEVVGCNNTLVDAAPYIEECGITLGEQYDNCSKYKKQVSSCGDIVWSYAGPSSNCPGCNIVYTNNQAQVYEESFTRTKNDCAVNCTGTSVTSSFTSVTNPGTVTGSSIQAANDNAYNLAVQNVQNLISTHAQLYANEHGSCNCSCVETWIDSSPLETLCGAQLPYDENNIIDGDIVETCWVYKKQINQCNSKSKWIKQIKNTDCPACICSSTWSDSVPLIKKCGSLIGMDVCKKFKKQVDTTCNQGIRWIEYSNSPDCPECCDPESWSDYGIAYCVDNDLYKQEINGCGALRETLVLADSPTCQLACISPEGIIGSTLIFRGPYPNQPHAGFYAYNFHPTLSGRISVTYHTDATILLDLEPFTQVFVLQPGDEAGDEPHFLQVADGIVNGDYTEVGWLEGNQNCAYTNVPTVIG